MGIPPVVVGIIVYFLVANGGLLSVFNLLYSPTAMIIAQIIIIFPIVITLAATLLVPPSTPLIGMLMFGNLLRESGVVDRLSKTAQNELTNLVTIFLGLAVGSKLTATEFLTIKTLLIIGLGLAAFSVGTASGVLLGKLLYLFSKGKVNPMIGAAGVSAVPMAARVSQKTAFFHLGNLVEFGNTETIFTQPNEHKTNDYIT